MDSLQIMQPTAIDDVLPVVDNVDDVDEGVLAQLTCNAEEGENNE